jgi:signal transduction histidine kinase
VRRYDGSYRWIVSYGVPRFESDGKFCGYIGSCVDLTERKSAAESLQALTGRLIHAQDEERRRVARELHDDFSRRSGILGINLAHLWRGLPESRVDDRARVREMLKGSNELSSDLHTLSRRLHSSRLEYVGLASALRGLCNDISQTYKIEVHFAEGELRQRPSKDVALCLFRIAQEALANVVKHSHATSANVELTTNAAGLRLRIADNGIGFDAAHGTPSPGIGLIGMQERIRLIDGRLLVSSEIARGTQILVDAPLYSSTNEQGERVQTARQ